MCPWKTLAARHGAHHAKRLGPRGDRVRQRSVRRFVREILLAGKEPHVRSAPLRDVVADRPTQHRIAGLERVEDCALRSLALNGEPYLAVDLRERPQMCREHDADHGSVWASTDSTAGRSRTMAAQLLPASADA